MKNLITIWKQKKEVQKQQDLKGRVLKNKEAMLDVMAQNIKGARQCPYLMGQKCIGQMCEFFMEFKNINDITKEEFTYYRCAIVQTPLLLIELIQNIRSLKEVNSVK